MAYRYFGDVVTFDTTYRTNKYNMPFAPFTGINHHMHQLILAIHSYKMKVKQHFLGCLRLGLKLWEVDPVSIITDQDLAMKSAISKVLPHTRHRLCI